MNDREKFIERTMAKCQHFTGVQHKTCKAGITYPEGPIPCIRFKSELSEANFGKCPAFAQVTREQAEANADEHDAHMDKMRKVMALVAPWRKEKPIGKTGILDCPACDGGKLHLSQASINGHVWGKCTTPNCVSWME